MPVTKKIPAGMHAVMAVDPGTHTGVAACYVLLDNGSVKDCLLNADKKRDWEFTGSWREVAQNVVDVWNVFQFEANVRSSLPLDNVHLVMENFQLRLPVRSLDREGLSPVWIAGMIEGALMPGTTPEYQAPSQAKQIGNDKRLRLWGCWVKGSPHKRDAWRHVGLKVGKLLDKV